MKIRILSDLHMEGASFTLKPTDADVLVLAGDIATLWHPRLPQFLAKTPENTVYVYGNHEAYSGLASDWDTEISPKCLNFKTRMIKGVKFIGTPLWTDFKLYGVQDESIRYAVRGISDFHTISGATPADYIARHARSREFIARELECDLPCVVVTHWGCGPDSIHPRWAKIALNPYFYSDCRDLFTDNLKLWIHGHTHDSVDYTHRGTRVVCNPRGYANGGKSENPSFSSTYTVTL